MNGASKKIEAMQTLNDIKNNIQSKYDKIMKRIGALKNELDKLDDASKSHSELWVKERRKTINDKIDRLTNDSKKWQDEQLKKAQNWLSNVESEANNSVIDLKTTQLSVFEV